MRKVILIFVLTILLLSFAIFFFKVYIEQKNYFTSKSKQNEAEKEIVVTEVVNPSIYKDYSKKDYDMAISENRVLVLFFSSNWCLECDNQDKINIDTFSSLTKEGVIGFKIHILDSETTTETDALGKKFDVTKESTFVFLDRSGAVSSKYVGSISSDILKAKIMEALNK